MSDESFKKAKGKFNPTLLLAQNPDLVPIILKKSSRATIPDLARNKVLLRSSNTVGDLYRLLRKQIDLAPEVALFFFIEDTIPSITALFGDLYRDYKQDDGVLYITYTDESVYGGNAKFFHSI